MRMFMLACCLVLACGEPENIDPESDPTCGDGVTDEGEECDNGQNGMEDSPDCFADCTLSTCGDDRVNSLEEDCDDGNTAGGDGCSATCELESIDACMAFTTITCDQTVMGRFDDPGSTTQIAEYNCSSNTFPGGEFVYEFIPAVPGPVQLLADVGGNAFVIDGRLDCGQLASCVAHSGLTEFTAVAGQRYLVVVEPLPESGPFFVTLRCN